MEELKDYAEFGIRDDMVSKDSSLNTPDVTDNIEFSGYNEGVPGESFLLGGIQMRKKMYADTTAGIWIGIDSDGKAKTNIGDSTNSVKWNGSTLAIAGALSASSLDIPDTTTANSFHVNTSGDTWWGAAAIGSAVAKILKTGVATFTNVVLTGLQAGSALDTTYLSGLIPQANLNVADRGWSQTCAFSITDADTVAWDAGTFTSADGTAYSISAGNTGNMAAKTFIYLDIAVSTTAYQTTTTATVAVGVGKVMIATAQNNTTEAVFTVLSGQGGTNIDAASIVAGSITANEIAATTITAAKMNVSQLSAISADMGAITAGTITAVGGGNTVAITPASATAIALGPTGAPTITMTASGLLTAVGLTSLNMKGYTCFETSTRFIISTGATTNAPAFGNQGVLISPSATASRYCKILWNVNGYVFNNNPSFTCSVQLLTLGTNSGVGFIGLGNPTISETGFTEINTHYCGFEFKKTAGTTTLIASQCDGTGTNTFSGTLLTLSSNSSLELFIKMTASGINYYTRVNGGALSSATTLTTNMPSEANVNIQFSSSNKGDAVDFQLQPWSASYEH